MRRGYNPRPIENSRRSPPRKKETIVLRLVLVLALTAVAPLEAFCQNRLGGSAAIDTYLDQAVKARIPGIVAVVADANGVLYSGAFGQQDVAKHVTMSADSIFRLASMTKPVTSVAVMMLVEEGKVSLD